MKIVNLKDYNEGDGLRNKLRQRVDKFEPELSDSLWDRIHHEMDVRETNRKRRFLWWFSSVAVVLLASGILAFLMVNSNARPTIVQQPVPVVQTPDAVQSEVGTVPQSTTTNNAAINSNQAPVVSETIAPAQPATNGGNSYNYGNNTPHTSEGRNNGNSDGQNGGGAEKPAGNGGTIETPATPVTIDTKNDINPDENKNDLNNNSSDVVDGDKGKTETQPDLPKGGVKEEKKEDVKPTSTNTDGDKTQPFKRFFVGAVYGYNMTYRTVSDVSKVFNFPNAKQKNDFEHLGYTSSYGLEFGYAPIKNVNVFIKSGVGIYKTEETFKYSIYPRKDLSGLIGGPGEPLDSVGVGNNITIQNTYTYVQIPLEVQYNIDVKGDFGICVSGGVAYNVLTSYNYNYNQPYYGRMVLSTDNNRSSFFTNYLQVGGSVGAQYSLGKNWRASAGINYCKAITSSSTKETGVDVRPWSLGGSAGLAFTF